MSFNDTWKDPCAMDWWEPPAEGELLEFLDEALDVCDRNAALGFHLGVSAHVVCHSDDAYAAVLQALRDDVPLRRDLRGCRAVADRGLVGGTVRVERTAP